MHRDLVCEGDSRPPFPKQLQPPKMRQSSLFLLVLEFVARRRLAEARRKSITKCKANTKIRNISALPSDAGSIPSLCSQAGSNVVDALSQDTLRFTAILFTHMTSRCDAHPNLLLSAVLLSFGFEFN